MLTPATDIYAYSIVCIEVLTMGELPWGCISDDEIRHNVLGKTLFSYGSREIYINADYMFKKWIGAP